MDTSRRGDWKAVCDRCGFDFWASELRKEWTGLYVCSADWEPRHPQEFVKGRADRQNVPWSRPQPADVFQTPGMWWFTDYDQSGEILTIF